MAYQKEISIPSLLFTSLSCMIGSGWLLGSYHSVLLAGPASLLAWVIGAAMIITIAFCFSELGTALPLSGGISRYSLLSHGRPFSFIMSWLAWISEVAVAPTEVHTILRYLSPYFPILSIQVDGVVVLSQVGFVIACVLLLLMVLINQAGIRMLLRYNNVFAIWKVCIPGFISLALIGWGLHLENFTQTTFMPYGWKGVFEAVSSTVIFSYLGFREATSLASEVKNPQKAIPIAVIGAVVFCCFFYIIIQFAFIGAIDPSNIGENWSSIGVQPEAPWVDLAMILGMLWIASLISADACVNPFGAGLIYTTTSSRVSYGMSQSGVFPKWLGSLNRFGVPSMALMFNLVVGILLFFPLPSWHELVKFQATAVVMAYAVGPISLLVLRKNLPHIHRPFKLKYATPFCYTTLFVCNLITYWTGWNTVSYLMLCILLGFTCYFFIQYYLDGKQSYDEHKTVYWLVPHLLGLSLISYAGDFDGGHAWLPNHVDYVLLLVLTILIMKLALMQALTSESSQEKLVEMVQDPNEGLDKSMITSVHPTV